MCVSGFFHRLETGWKWGKEDALYKQKLKAERVKATERRVT